MVEEATTTTTTPQVVPVVEQLTSIYQDVNDSIAQKHKPRYENLQRRFKDLYGVAPAFYCRAPGRVNIIGEHIDYCGYSVLPAALEQDFIMAYVLSDDAQVVINNIDKDQYKQIVLSTEPTQDFHDSGSFVNYWLCGYKAILAFDSPVKGSVAAPKGMKILIDSVVPAAAGLSSSSAFTVCAAITTAHANGVLDQLDQAQLAELTISAERCAGTACGGMDQTISIMGQFNKAKLIDFVPALKATTVDVPSSVSLVVANSLTPSAKVLTVGTRYNKRVVECRFAVALLAMRTGVTNDFLECPVTTFQQLQVHLGQTSEGMIKIAKEQLRLGGYTPAQIERDGNVDDPFELVHDVPHAEKVRSQNAQFFLQERACHVYAEAQRVQDFKTTCESTEMEDEQKIVRLGELMNASHQSCDELYDCSSPNLNELIGMCRRAGALGSRLTGAGWGGCCVSLVRKADVPQFIESVLDYYTKERGPGQQLWITDDLYRYIFGTAIGQGACVLDPQYCIWNA